MSSPFDSSDFVDTDFQTSRKSAFGGATGAATTAMPSRPPTREEIDSKVNEAQVKLAELRRQQEELERERAALEETRRRQIEFKTGREEMLQNLTRGVGLLEESEFAARRDAEQMARTVADFKDALSKVQILNEETWSKENFSVELTRALTTLENARMEWNAARLKFPALSGTAETGEAAAPKATQAGPLASMNFLQLCKVGLALTWPVLLAGLGIGIVLIVR